MAPPAAPTYRYVHTGQRLDPASGLYYYKARWYSPNLGRFLQTDPVGTADQINLYAYVANDPVNLIDPTGMTTVDGVFYESLITVTARLGLPQGAMPDGSTLDTRASQNGNFAPGDQAEALSEVISLGGYVQRF